MKIYLIIIHININIKIIQIFNFMKQNIMELLLKKCNKNINFAFRENIN